MLNIPFRRNSHLHKLLSDQGAAFSVGSKSPEEKVRLLIVRDLMRLGWEITFKENSVLIKPPASYDKQVVRDSMQIKRQESLAKHIEWLRDHEEIVQQNLADGKSVWDSNIQPVIEVCESQKQFNVFCATDFKIE